MTVRSVCALVVVTTVAVTAPVAAPAAEPDARIEGRVVVIGDDEKPVAVAGATVDAVRPAWPTSSAPPFDPTPAQVLATGTTGADGTFAIEKLPPGRVALVVRGKPIATQPCGYFECAPGSRFTGIVVECSAAKAVAARIVRADGGPVAGLDVVAWDDREPCGERAVVRGRTATDGSIRVEGTVRTPRLAVRLGPDRWVALEQDRDRDVQFDGAAFTVGGTCTLDVTVVGPDGRPVPDARVACTNDTVDARGRTAADGRCRLEGLAEAAIALSVSAPGLAPVRVETGHGGPTLSAAKPAAVTTALEKACTLTGMVVDAAAHTPITGARVRFASVSTLDLEVPSVTTDAEGRFTLGGLPRGAGIAVADADGFMQPDIWQGAVWATVLNLGYGPKPTGPLSPGAGGAYGAAGSTADLQITLEKRSPSIVLVRSKAGPPIPGAIVFSMPPKSPNVLGEARGRFWPYLAWWGAAFTNDQGRAATTDDLSQAEILVVAEGFERGFGRKPAADGTRTITLRPE